jgi:hypothetical protein
MILFRATGLCVCTALLSLAALAASVTQSATLKDLQTVGSTTKKQKHQQYDFVVNTPTNEYVCRTKLGSSMKPTQFVVGSDVQFKVNGQKGEVWNSAGNHMGCGIVKVVAPNTPYSQQ